MGPRRHRMSRIGKPKTLQVLDAKACPLDRRSGAPGAGFAPPQRWPDSGVQKVMEAASDAAVGPDMLEEVQFCAKLQYPSRLVWCRGQFLPSPSHALAVHARPCPHPQLGKDMVVAVRGHFARRSLKQGAIDRRFDLLLGRQRTATQPTAVPRVMVCRESVHD